MSRTVLVSCVCLLAACAADPPAGLGDEAADATGAPVLARVSGDSQAGEAGRLLAEFLVFRVTDPAGRPLAGLRVEWEVVTGGGQVSGKRHETDVMGLAAGNFTLGPEPGKNVARATLADGHAIEFTAFSIEAAPDPDEPDPRVVPTSR